MLVLGMLQKAQWEQKADANPTAWGLGAFYIDSTDPLNGVPKIWNGTVWKEFLFEISTDFVTQNSGKDVTVDWSTSINQKVLLTDNCVIRFTNPQAGKLLTLIVVQKSAGISTNPLLFTFDMPDQDPGKFPFQPEPIMYGGTKTFQWQCQPALIPGNNSISFNSIQPPQAPITITSGMSFSPKGDFLFYGQNAAPFQAAHLFNPDVAYWAAGGWGTRNPFAPVNLGIGVVDTEVDPLNRGYVYLASNTSPFILGQVATMGIPQTSAGFANPSVLPTGAGRCIAAYPGGDFVAIGHTTSPFMSCYPLHVNGAGWGVKIPDPSSLPAGQVNAIAFSPQGDFLTVASQTSPYIETYPFQFTGTSTSFGPKVANPSQIPNGGPGAVVGKALAWRPQGDFIAMLMSASPYLYVVPFDRSTGTYGLALTLFTTPPQPTSCLAWSKCGTYLFVGMTASPYLIIYDFSSSTINPTISTPIQPAVAMNSIQVHPMNRVFVTAPNNISLYQWQMPWRTKNYLRVL